MHATVLAAATLIASFLGTGSGFLALPLIAERRGPVRSGLGGQRAAAQQTAVALQPPKLAHWPHVSAAEVTHGRNRVTDVAKRFGQTYAVRDVTFRAPKGCFFAVLGPLRSGAAACGPGGFVCGRALW